MVFIVCFKLCDTDFSCGGTDGWVEMSVVRRWRVRAEAACNIWCESSKLDWTFAVQISVGAVLVFFRSGLLAGLYVFWCHDTRLHGAATSDLQSYHLLCTTFSGLRLRFLSNGLKFGPVSTLVWNWGSEGCSIGFNPVLYRGRKRLFVWTRLRDINFEQ